MSNLTMEKSINGPPLQETASSEEFTIDSELYCLMMRACSLLGEDASSECMEKLGIDLRNAFLEDNILYRWLEKWILDLMQFLTGEMHRDVVLASRESKIRILVVYMRRFETFKEILILFIRIAEALGFFKTRCLFWFVCLDFWVETVIRANILVPRLAEVLTQKIVEKTGDEVQLNCTSRILHFLPRLPDKTRAKFLKQLEIWLGHLIFHAMLKLVTASLNQCSCSDTITMMFRLEGEIKDAAKVLGLSNDFRYEVMSIFRKLSDVIFHKSAYEASLKYNQFAAKHTSNPMPLKYNHDKSCIKAIWEPVYSDNTKIPEELMDMRMHFVSMGLISGIPPSTSWITQASFWVNSRIMTFPTDPSLCIMDSRAYINFYYESWTAHCKFTAFYQIFTSRVFDEFEREGFLTQCFRAWEERVVDVERENIQRHLAILLRQCLSDPGVEPDEKILSVIYSFGFLRATHRRWFQNYFHRHVMIPYADEMAGEFERKLETEFCIKEMLQTLRRVRILCSKLSFHRSVSRVFTERIGTLLLRFAISQLTPPLESRRFDLLNQISISAAQCDTSLTEEFFRTVTTRIEQHGRREIAIKQRPLGEGLHSLAKAILAASHQFEEFWVPDLDSNLKLAMLTGFRSAVHLEATSQGFSVLGLLTEYFLPAMDDLPVDVWPVPESENMRTLLVARSLKYVSHLKEFPKLVVESLATRVLTAKNFSSCAEFERFQVVRELLGPHCEYLRPHRQHLADLALSHRRMQYFPSVCGFTRATSIASTETDEEKIEKAVQALLPCGNKIQPIVGPDETLTFEGIEFNIRILRADAWTISTTESAFKPPPILQRIIDTFTTVHHQVEDKNRNLTWVHQALGIGMLWRFTPDQRVYEVRCDSFVAAVLLMFEDIDEVTFEAMRQETNISVNNLRTIVNELLKRNVLVCRKNYHMEETLALNVDFHSTAGRVFIECAYEQTQKFDRTPREQSSSRSAKRGQKTDSAPAHHAAMMRVAKRYQQMSKKELLEETIWELKTMTYRTSSLLPNALNYLVQINCLGYDTSSRLFNYVP